MKKQFYDLLYLIGWSARKGTPVLAGLMIYHFSMYFGYLPSLQPECKNSKALVAILGELKGVELSEPQKSVMQEIKPLDENDLKELLSKKAVLSAASTVSNLNKNKINLQNNEVEHE